jgi:dolichol-phosphate mannosyltransferase
MSQDPELSVVIPVFNEVENVSRLWEELDDVLGRLGLSAEIVFVDDGSTDGSADAIRAVMKQDARVRLLCFAANAGLTAAFHAGYGAARGRIVVTLDADLQNDPRDLPSLLAALEGADAVVGWRRARHDPWLKRISSRVGNAVRNRLTGDDVRDSACSLRAMRRECLGAIPPYTGMHRFVPTLLRTAGYRVVEVPVHHRPRRFGRSKFGIRNRALRALIDLLAVRWMMRRALRYQVREVVGEAQETALSSTAGRARGGGA